MILIRLLKVKHKYTRITQPFEHYDWGSQRGAEIF